MLPLLLLIFSLNLLPLTQSTQCLFPADEPNVQKSWAKSDGNGQLQLVYQSNATDLHVLKAILLPSEKSTSLFLPADLQYDVQIGRFNDEAKSIKKRSKLNWPVLDKLDRVVSNPEEFDLLVHTKTNKFGAFTAKFKGIAEDEYLHIRFIKPGQKPDEAKPELIFKFFTKIHIHTFRLSNGETNEKVEYYGKQRGTYYQFYRIGNGMCQVALGKEDLEKLEKECQKNKGLKKEVKSALTIFTLQNELEELKEQVESNKSEIDLLKTRPYHRR